MSIVSKTNDIIRNKPVDLFLYATAISAVGAVGLSCFLGEQSCASLSLIPIAIGIASFANIIKQHNNKIEQVMKNR